MNTRLLAHLGSATLSALLLAGCGESGMAGKSAPKENADQFVARLNSELTELSLDSNQSGWLQATYINDDSQAVSARSSDRYLAYFNAAVKQAKGYDGQPMAPASRRASASS